MNWLLNGEKSVEHKMLMRETNEWSFEIMQAENDRTRQSFLD